jgi:hypothetical protein
MFSAHCYFDGFRLFPFSVLDYAFETKASKFKYTTVYAAEWLPIALHLAVDVL